MTLSTVFRTAPRSCRGLSRSVGPLALIASFTAAPALADIRDDIRILTDDVGLERLETRGQIFDLGSAMLSVEAVEGEFALISSYTGGSACPVEHYWLDLSGAAPVLSDAFGHCAEGAEMRPAENGAIVTRILTQNGPVDFLYRGGVAVEERKAPLEASGVSRDASAEELAQAGIFTLFTAGEWEADLRALVGTEAFDSMQFYMSGPGDQFKRDGSWVSASACGRSLCNSRYIAMAIEPTSGAILVARYGDFDDEGFEAWGSPDGPLPTKVAEVVRESASAAAMERAFSGLGEGERRALQELLRVEGLYQSRIDGAFGSGTQAGIVGLAIARAGDFGAIPDLTRDASVRRFLTSMLGGPDAGGAGAASSEQLLGVAEPYPFEGVWDCEVGTFTFSHEIYDNGWGARLRYASIEAFADRTTFGLTFEDGYRLGLLDVTATSMIWSSPGSGDVFECRRTDDGPAEAPASAPAEAAAPAEAMPALESGPAPAEGSVSAGPTALDGAPEGIQGLWDCDGQVFVLSRKTAIMVNQAFVTEVVGSTEDGEGGWRIDIDPGAPFRVSDVTPSSASVEVPGMGEMACVRKE